MHIPPEQVQKAFDMCTWGNVRETAADWVRILEEGSSDRKKILFNRLFNELPDAGLLRRLFTKEDIRYFLEGMNRTAGKSFVEHRRRVWRRLYLDKAEPVPELDWCIR